MIVAETVVGSIEEFDDHTIEYVRLSDAERKRSRVRTTTDAGTDVGLVLGDTSVEAGDVVYADDERAIAIAFEDRAALAIDLEAVVGEGPTNGCLLEVGHFLGNRHYDLAVDGATAFVPVEADRPIADAIRARLPEGAELTHREVDPTLFDESGPPEDSHGLKDDHDHGSSHHHERDSNHENPGTRTHDADEDENSRTDATGGSK